jgi:hypothetical protein
MSFERSDLSKQSKQNKITIRPFASFPPRNREAVLSLKRDSQEHLLNPLIQPPSSLTQPANQPNQLRRILNPLPRIKRQPIRLRLKRNHTPLRKVKNIPLHRMHSLTRLIADVEFPFHNNLHLVVRVRVH